MVILVAFSATALEEDYFQSEFYTSGKRDVSVIASPEGYYPKDVVVFAGEEVQFFVTGSNQFPSCFILENSKVFLPANPGHISEAAISSKDLENLGFIVLKERFRAMLPF